VCERRPPEAGDGLTALADRTFDIAAKLLDPDVFASGETSAIANEAVLALCVLGDRRALECVECAKALKRRWVIRKLRNRLEETRAAWGEDVQEHDASALVRKLLSALD
jgi:hypothetical protein